MYTPEVFVEGVPIDLPLGSIHLPSVSFCKKIILFLIPICKTLHKE